MGLSDGLTKLEESISYLRKCTEASTVKGLSFDSDYHHDAMDTTGVLEGIPRLPLHLLLETNPNPSMIVALSCFLRDIMFVEWITKLLSAVIKIAYNPDIGSRGRKEWQEEISSKEFQTLSTRLSTLYRCSLYEVCRIRTEKDFDQRDDKRWRPPGDSNYHPASYRLRIVCPEGAVVRDGIDIDSCASVGSLEMGEEVYAFDRCVNGSGIMRYRTARGWVSEQTRGHGREPISEVLEVHGTAGERCVQLKKNPKTKKAIECGIPDLCAVSASVLARLQNSQCQLYACLSRAIVMGSRSLPSLEDITGSHISILTHEISRFIRSNFNMVQSSRIEDPENLHLNQGGETMYLGNMLNILHSCIYEERRDKQILNVLIFCNLLVHDGLSDTIFIPELHSNENGRSSELPTSGFYGAIRSVLRYGLMDMATNFHCEDNEQEKHAMIQRQSKIVASSFPPALSLLQRLNTQSLQIDPSLGSYLNKMNGKDFINFIAGDLKDGEIILANNIFSFRVGAFARSVHCTIAFIAEELWSDSNLKYAPPHVLNPILSFMSEVFVSLEKSSRNDASEEIEEPVTRPSLNQSWGSRRPLATDLGRSLPAPFVQGSQGEEVQEDVSPSPPFEPNEETVTRMVEMGFSRDHALNAIESSRSNDLEVAMEYALSHPYPDSLLRRGTVQTLTNTETTQSNAQENTGSNDEEMTDTTVDVQNTAETSNTSLAGSSKEDGETKPIEKSFTEAEKKKSAEKDFDSKTRILVCECMDKLKESIVENAIHSIEGPLFGEKKPSIEKKALKGIESDSEVVNVIVCTFLLDVCDRYPGERSRIVIKLLERLKSHVQLNSNGHHIVMDGKEKEFASICHATVIFLRALPRSRSLALKHNLVTCLLECLRAFSLKLKHSRSMDKGLWPCWLSPSLLLIDVMSQPISLEDKKISAENKQSSVDRGDYSRVVAEHKRQQMALTKASKRISAAIEKSKGNNKKVKEKEAKEAKKTDGTTPEGSTETVNESTNPFTDVPTYSPLITSDMAESYLTICLQIFRIQQKKTEAKEEDVFFIPPSITHALLLVLSKVLRSQKLGSLCLRTGGTELLLSLQNKNRFNGHISLITLILHRMIEDESILQTSMESEIRSTVTKLLKKNRASLSASQTISTRSFVENISQLICRDPIIFLKAAATSIKVIPNGFVVLLPADERAKNAKALADYFRSNCPNNISHSTINSKPLITTGVGNKRGRQHKTKQNQKSPKSKSPHRGSKKAQKKEKQDRFINVVGSPANHVTSQLLTSLLRHYQVDEINDILPFFCVKELLQMIGDLLLSIPACAAAIHSYQVINCNVRIKHAFLGSQPPTQNIINFLLHEVLSQPRCMPAKRREQGDDLSKADKAKAREPFMKTKTSQYAARLLVMLVARAGEGRRRVISELSNALMAGNDDVDEENVNSNDDDREMWALNSWGELCIGLAAPRRINHTHDAESTLSYEVVKVMQECGMAHALIGSIRRIKLLHPLAATTAAALLRPLENFTRPAVIEALESMAKKADKKIELTRKVDDSMLGDEFNVDAENPMSETDGGSDDDVDMGNDFDDSNPNPSFDEMEDDSIIMSDEDEGSESSDSEDSDDSDDETSSDQDSDELDEEIVEDGEHAMEVEDNEDDDNEIDIAEPGSIEMQVDDGDTDLDFFEGNDEVEDEVEEHIEIDGDFDGEAWTTVDAGLGNMFSRNEAPAVGRPRTNGGGTFMIEAAETVIGNILRSGGLHIDALAEIEDTLGIRIANRSTDADQSRFARLRPPIPSSNRNRSSNSNDEGPVGAVPIISQNGPPDNFFSSTVNTGIPARSGEINFMEYHYGGPPLGSNRAYYDSSGSDSLVEDVYDELLQAPSSFDVQLFPSGSAASTHARPLFIPHPLISGISLPPSNALVSLTTRLREETRPDRGWAARRPGNGTRIDIFGRPAGISRSINGWTGNGQPVDSIATDFSLAFERGLTSTILNSSPAQTTSVNNTDSANTSNEVHSEEHPTRDSNGDPELSNGIVNNDRVEESEVADEDNPDVAREDNNLSDRENAFSSLAASLTLSNTEQIENMHNNDAENDNAESNDDVNAENDNAESNDGENNNAENDNVESNDGENNNAENDNVESNNAENDNVESNDGENNNAENDVENNNEQETNSLTCPPGVDIEVFSQLPIEMQQEIIEQHRTTENVAAQLDETSGLDPDVLAALPEEMRREVIEQEQNERRLRDQEQTPADPSNAEEMDNASFIASLAPDLRREILLTTDNSVLNSLPPDIIAEAQLLRQRAESSRHRRDNIPNERHENPSRRWRSNPTNENASATQTRAPSKKKSKTGKIRVENDRVSITYEPKTCDKDYGPLLTPSSIKPLISLMYLLSPVRPQRLLQKLFQNFSINSDIRHLLIKTFVALLNDEQTTALTAINSIGKETNCNEKDRLTLLSEQKHVFPPSCLLGTAPDTRDTESANMGLTFFRRRQRTSTAAAIASNLPLGARCSLTENTIPPVVARRVVGTLTFLSKNAPRTSLDILNNFGNESDMPCLDSLLGLLGKQSYSQSSSNLEDLLNLIESICVPLSSIPGDNDNYVDVPKKDLDSAADAGKEWVDVPRAIISPQKLHLLCTTLRLESCKDGIFVKVNNIARRLCKVVANRDCILRELASVAQSLGIDATRELRALRIRLNKAVEIHNEHLNSRKTREADVLSIPSTTVTLSTSNSELKLLRVLQTLHSLCAVLTDDNGNKRNDGSLVVREELVSLLQGINLGPVWEQLSACLSIVSVLEGVSNDSDEENGNVDQDEDGNGDSGNNEAGKKLQNSVAGLLSRFLPTIEAFFVVNASTIDTAKCIKDTSSEDHNDVHKVVGEQHLIDFVAANKILINAILRSSPSLLDKGLRAMVRIPRCKPFMDFDVKRQWFRTQVRRLRQQASRRYGNLPLTIRREHVFSDAYNQLSLREAVEMRGRLHIKFVNEEGVDAGGLSREFFGILAKEMFNPNYALFTSTEDGCTFQPNPHSSINHDHLKYFRFVGRIVGKAVADGYLMDAHFTRSLYKHMLGMKVRYYSFFCCYSITFLLTFLLLSFFHNSLHTMTCRQLTQLTTKISK